MAPDALRAEAEEVARSLPGLNLKARAADAAHLGAAGRKRAGTGEQFWQYRHYSQEDTAQRSHIADAFAHNFGSARTQRLTRTEGQKTPFVEGRGEAVGNGVDHDGEADPADDCCNQCLSPVDGEAPAGQHYSLCGQGGVGLRAGLGHEMWNQPAGASVPLS